MQIRGENKKKCLIKFNITIDVCPRVFRPQKEKKIFLDIDNFNKAARYLISN